MNRVAINSRHFVFAFLCIKNRSMTMSKHNCDEWDLKHNPQWLLTHYFVNSGVELNDLEQKEILSFLDTRLGKQITEAFLCPLNRHCTRVKHSCNDEDFLKNKNYKNLLENYILNGGAEVFAKKEREIF